MRRGWEVMCSSGCALGLQMFCFQKLFPLVPFTVAILLCFRAKAHFPLEVLPTVVAQGSWVAEYSSPPAFPWAYTFQDPQWVSETTDSTELSMNYVVFYTYIPMRNFNLYIRHSKRLTTTIIKHNNYSNILQ